jgi:hypothetical protein
MLQPRAVLAVRAEEDQKRQQAQLQAGQEKEKKLLAFQKQPEQPRKERGRRHKSL